MASMPEAALEAWNNRNGPAVLATVSPEGVPNIIYVGCVGALGDDRLVVADNYFDKTRKNLCADGGCPGALLFRSEAGKAYQVKGPLEYHTEGEVFEDMKKWNTSHPGHAAAVLRVEEVYSGADKLC